MGLKPKLIRQMGLFTVIATGVSSMVGASINVVPFMIHRSVPNLGPNVLWAFAFAAVPALFAGLAYAILSSAMPRAGGSYLYASRGLNPYWTVYCDWSDCLYLHSLFKRHRLQL
jgi:amino acid transporter